MKRRLFTVLIACAMCSIGFAQARLNINQLFDGRYKKSPTAVEINVKEGRARALKLRTYHSLSLAKDVAGANLMEALVLADGHNAIDNETEYRKGKLYYAFYQLVPEKIDKKIINRFIFYLNQNLSGRHAANKVTLIYIDGEVSSEYVKQLIRQ